MADVVVTIPKARWLEWISEGDIPGARWSGTRYGYRIRLNGLPSIEAGERVYVVAHGKLRGYAPLMYVDVRGVPGSSMYDVELVRGGGAVAVTIDQPIPGFRGLRYRWWRRADERPFLGWAAP